MVEQQYVSLHEALLCLCLCGVQVRPYQYCFYVPICAALQRYVLTPYGEYIYGTLSYKKIFPGFLYGVEYGQTIGECFPNKIIKLSSHLLVQVWLILKKVRMNAQSPQIPENSRHTKVTVVYLLMSVPPTQQHAHLQVIQQAKFHYGTVQVLYRYKYTTDQYRYVPVRGTCTVQISPTGTGTVYASLKAYRYQYSSNSYLLCYFFSTRILLQIPAIMRILYLEPATANKTACQLMISLPFM